MATTVRKTPAARGSITKEVIVAAVLAQIDERGVAAFSMRRLATELGVTTMATYWHARNKQEVLDWVVELVLENVDAAAPDRGTWDEKIGELLAATRATLLEHPNVIDLLGQREHFVPAFVRVSNELILLIGEGGFTGDDRVLAFSLVMTHFYGSLLITRLRPDFPRTSDLHQLHEASGWVPPDRFAAVEGEFVHFEMTTERQFREGVRALLRGLADGRA